MFGAIRRFNKRNAVRMELEALTDRELNDIGISRCDIPHIVRQQYKRK